MDVAPCPCPPNVVLTLPLNGDALALVIMVLAALTVANIFAGDPLGRGSAGYGRLMRYNSDSYREVGLVA